MQQYRYGPNSDQMVDVYTVTNEDAQWIFLVHGGNWRQEYTKALMDPLVDVLTEAGFNVVNIEYRRGEHQWPAPLQDVKSAIEFIKTSDFYNDTSLILIGHSVGGQIAAFTSHLVSQTVLLAPVVDLIERREKQLGNNAVKEYFRDVDCSDLKKASPIYNTPIEANTLIIHGFDDEKVHIETTLDYINKNNKNRHNITLFGYPLMSHLDLLEPSHFHIEPMIHWIKN